MWYKPSKPYYASTCIACTWYNFFENGKKKKPSMFKLYFTLFCFFCVFHPLVFLVSLLCFVFGIVISWLVLVSLSTVLLEICDEA